MVCTRKIAFLVTNLMHVVISQNIMTDHLETLCKNLETVKEIESFKQQIAKQVHSLINDVILMKKELNSKVQQIERNTNEISDIQKNLQNLSSKFTTSQDKVAFNAVRNTILNRTADITKFNIVYDTVLYDSHNAYNNQTGVFKAPTNGLYIFTWTSAVETNKTFNSELLLNGIRMGLSGCNNQKNMGYENCANTIPLLLQSGDSVNIRMTNGNYLHGYHWSSFKGWKN